MITVFNFIKRTKNAQELDSIIARIELNASNNYKDEAQAALKELEKRFAEMVEAGTLNERQMQEYSIAMSSYKEKMKGYTHKDQKATW